MPKELSRRVFGPVHRTLFRAGLYCLGLSVYWTWHTPAGGWGGGVLLGIGIGMGFAGSRP